ncbi:glycosyltransferase [Rhodococcus sp. WS4]|nr:glycosyltransferase [Rhodococcus sp. WS4]
MSGSTRQPNPPNTGTPELSVVIPAFNSERVLESTVRSFAEHFAGRDVEIIVVQNGSTDSTVRVCRALADEWTDPTVSFTCLNSAKGMGNALRAGALASRGDRVLLTADDLPFGFGDIDAADRLEREWGQLPPVIIGSKAHPESVVDRGPLRSAMTTGFGTLRRALLGTRTGDPQGTFVVDGTLLRSLADRLSEPGFLFTTELTYALELSGIEPVEVPVRLNDDHRAHPSRIALTDVVRMAWGLLSLRRRRQGLGGASVNLSGTAG